MRKFGAEGESKNKIQTTENKIDVQLIMNVTAIGRKSKKPKCKKGN